jgi:hypothetical protein
MTEAAQKSELVKCWFYQHEIIRHELRALRARRKIHENKY